MANLRTDRADPPPPMAADQESPVEVAVEAVEAVIVERRRFWRHEYTALAAVCFIVALAAFAVYVLDANPVSLRRYGYIGVFLIPMIGSASFILPMPGLAVIAGAAALLDPLFGLPPWLAVGLIAGLGETVGELTGYTAGYGGRAVLEQRRFLAPLERWMRRQGVLTMFVMAVIPNPLFDVAGVLAGVVRMPIWQFFLAVLVGKIIKATYVAGLAVLGIETVQRWLG
jgi:membrane protein YqaA with SNARE-associated domain